MPTKDIHEEAEAPKSMDWKVRARAGEKAPWYELPEAGKEIVG